MGCCDNTRCSMVKGTLLAILNITDQTPNPLGNMNLVTIREFSKSCGLTYEAIRIKIKSGEIKTYKGANLIDVEKYNFIIQYCQNRLRAKGSV